MRPTRMVNGKDEGVYEMHRGPLEVAAWVAMFGVIVGFLSWLGTGQISLGRGQDEIKGDVKELRSEFNMRTEQRTREHDQLVAVDAEAVKKIQAMAEQIDSIEKKVDHVDEGQNYNRSVLDKLPRPIQRRQQ